MLRPFAAIAAFALPLSLAHAARADDAPLAKALDAYVQATAEAKGFSGSVLVAQKGKVLLKKGYGLADAEHHVANTPETKFRLGSVTKQFTAALIEQLAQEGKLQVTDPVCKWIEPCPAAWKEITLHHLLTHTAGVPNYTSFKDFAREKTQPHTPQQLLALVADKPLDFAPGSKFHYSNSGYAVLGIVAERAGGKPYEQLLRERLFAPAGMTSSGYDHAETVLEHRAHGYGKDAEGNLRNASYTDMSVPFSAGGVYSTVEDLLRWDEALGGEKVLNKASLAQLTTPFKSDYAYGWIVERQWNHKVIWHNGGIDGFASIIERFPEDAVTVIVLSNREDAPIDAMGKDLAGLVFGEKVTAPRPHVEAKIDPAILPQYVGEYELVPGFVLSVTTEGGHLLTQATGQGRIEVFPEGDDRFFLKVVDAQLTFQRDEKKAVTAVVLDQGDAHLTGKRKK